MRGLLIVICLVLFIGPAEAGKVRVYYKADKSVVVVHPAPNAQREGESEQAFLDRVGVKAAKAAKVEDRPYDDIDVADLPDRTNRDEWEGSKGEPITVNQAKVAAKKREKKIRQEMKAVMRKQAIANLKASGEIE